MSATRIKICGITTPDDARLAAEAGADYIGVVFAESPRRVELERAREIRAAVPDARLVGVFKDQPLDEVARLAAASGVNLVQLHGRESPAFCDEVLRATGKPVIKVFNSSRIPDTTELASYQTTSYFMFDLDKSAAGSDAEIERIWSEVSKTRGQGFRVFLAGSLDASNVREAIRRSKAFAVDVCRGVESGPGVKDPESLARFVEEARS